MTTDPKTNYYTFIVEQCHTNKTTNRFGWRRYLLGSVCMTSLESYSNLTNIHKEFDYIGGVFIGRNNATHILGLLLIPGLQRVFIDDDGPIDKIMNAHLVDEDIISAQDELIDAGFKEQAKL